MEESKIPERIVKLEIVLEQLVKSNEKLELTIASRFDKLENDFRNAAREDRLLHDQSIGKVQDSFMKLLKEESDRQKEHMLAMQVQNDKRYEELKPLQKWIVMAMGAVALLIAIWKPLMDLVLKVAHR